MQLMSLFCCLVIFSLPITGMERKRSGDQIEPKSKKSQRADPEVGAEIRILQNICALHCYFRGIATSKNSPHGQ